MAWGERDVLLLYIYKSVRAYEEVGVSASNKKEH